MDLANKSPKLLFIKSSVLGTLQKADSDYNDPYHEPKGSLLLLLGSHPDMPGPDWKLRQEIIFKH